MKRTSLLAALLFVAACGTDLLFYQSVAGSFSGAFASTESSGDRLDGQLDFMLSQTDDMLTGTWEVDGTITGTGTTPMMAEGDLFGTLPVGDNPTFSVWLTYDSCPNDLMAFSLSYDSNTEELTLFGDLEILSSQCGTLTDYPLLLTLDRSTP